MTETKLSVDVYCQWVGYPPAYRVYVDGDLITERTYIWDGESQFVREHLVVNTGAGQHSIVVEPIVVAGMLANFIVKNLQVDGQPKPLVNNTFTI